MQDHSVLPGIPEPGNKAAKADNSRSKHAALGPDHPKIKFLAMAFLLILSVAAGFLGGWLSSRSNTDNTPIKEQQVIMKTQGQVISTIAKNVGESVVSVNVTLQDQSPRTIFDYYYGGDGAQEGEAAGTGIILTEEGLVVTNRHVVPANTTKVSVTLADGTELDDVTVVGRTNTSDSLDVAFLKINDAKGKKLQAAKIGDSSKSQIGEPVVAIGNALGQFQNTVTSGILSGYGRHVQASGSSGEGVENLEGLLQTDAAINQGNSGGPLVNLDGEVIGINTAVAGGDAENIGFAIPINDVKGLIDSVMKTGKLQRPYLGVVYIPLTNDIAKSYNLSVTRGAYIAPPEVSGTESIVADGPAAKAGLKAGDVITKINDTTVDQTNSLSAVVNKYKVGEKVKLTIVRDGKTQTLDVTLGAAPTGN
jgi:S1-C subfamily serine protease